MIDNVPQAPRARRWFSQERVTTTEAQEFPHTVKENKTALTMSAVLF
jgi:hypothetical protein